MKKLTADVVRNLLDYEQLTGLLRWRPRSVGMFKDGKHNAAHKCAKWNARYAGTVAGTLNGVGYLRIKIFNHDYLVHRLAWLIMTGEWPTHMIDHINLDKVDNRWRNLRCATRAQNFANRSVQRNNTSGLKGVCWDRSRSKWKAYINKDGRKYHLGYFDTAEEAHAAYVAAAFRLFGEFARAA